MSFEDVREDPCIDSCPISIHVNTVGGLACKLLPAFSGVAYVTLIICINIMVSVGAIPNPSDDVSPLRILFEPVKPLKFNVAGDRV